MKKALLVILLLLTSCQSTNTAPTQVIAGSKCWVLSWRFDRIDIIWSGAPAGAKDYKAEYLIIDLTGIAIFDTTDSWSSTTGAVIMQKNAGFWNQLWQMSGLTCQADYETGVLRSEVNQSTFIGNFTNSRISIFYFPWIPDPELKHGQ